MEPGAARYVRKFSNPTSTTVVFILVLIGVLIGLLGSARVNPWW